MDRGLKILIFLFIVFFLFVAILNIITSSIPGSLGFKVEKLQISFAFITLILLVLVIFFVGFKIL